MEYSFCPPSLVAICETPPGIQQSASFSRPGIAACLRPVFRSQLTSQGKLPFHRFPRAAGKPLLFSDVIGTVGIPMQNCAEPSGENCPWLRARDANSPALGSYRSRKARRLASISPEAANNRRESGVPDLRGQQEQALKASHRFHRAVGQNAAS